MENRSDALRQGQGACSDEMCLARAEQPESERTVIVYATRAWERSHRRLNLDELMAEGRAVMEHSARVHDPTWGVPFLKFARGRVRRRLFRVARYKATPHRWLENVLNFLTPQERKNVIASGRLLENLRRYVAELSAARELLSDDEAAALRAFYGDAHPPGQIALEHDMSGEEVVALRESGYAKLQSYLVAAGLLRPAPA